MGWLLWKLPMLLAVATLTACHPTTRRAEAPPSPRVELVGAHLVERVAGQKVWELRAHKALYQNARRVATLDQVETRFYEDGALVSSGTAPTATFHLGDRRLELADVKFTSADGQTGFTASAATWLPGPGKLRAEGPVQFWRGGYRLAAGSLEADRALRRVHLGGGVSGHGPSNVWGSPPDRRQS